MSSYDKYISYSFSIPQLCLYLSVFCLLAMRVSVLSHCTCYLYLVYTKREREILYIQREREPSVYHYGSCKRCVFRDLHLKEDPEFNKLHTGKPGYKQAVVRFCGRKRNEYVKKLIGVDLKQKFQVTKPSSG